MFSWTVKDWLWQCRWRTTLLSSQEQSRTSSSRLEGIYRALADEVINHQELLAVLRFFGTVTYVNSSLWKKCDRFQRLFLVFIKKEQNLCSTPSHRTSSRTAALLESPEVDRKICLQNNKKFEFSRSAVKVAGVRMQNTAPNFTIGTWYFLKSVMWFHFKWFYT